MDSFDSLSPSIPIGHRSWKGFWTASSVCPELMTGRSVLLCPCVGVHWKISLVSSSLLHLLGLAWFVGFYGISTFVGYLTPNPFLCKYSVLFKTIQFSISTLFNCQKYFHFKLFKQLYVTIQLSVNTVLMSKNSSISNNTVKHEHAV